MTSQNRSFQLITGRTIKQAQGMHKGKTTQAYQDATTLMEMSQPDMESLGLVKGDKVRLVSRCGEALVTVNQADLPQGMLFMPMGEAANHLIDAYTNSTGMPPFKSMMVEVHSS